MIQLSHSLHGTWYVPSNNTEFIIDLLNQGFIAKL